MSAIQMVSMIGKKITIFDRRTGHCYESIINDVKEVWGKLRIQLSQDSLNDVWFEPDTNELRSIK